MKKPLLALIAIVLGLAATTLTALRQPAVQTALLDRVISQRMNAVPAGLFGDDALRAVLCGSAAPMPHATRAAACVMVIAGGRYYLVDTGNRSANKLGLWRIPAHRVGAVLLSHYHSDHIGDLGEFNMMSWAQGRPRPLDVYGPPGVHQVVKGFSDAYALDSIYRTAHHGAAYLNPEIGRMQAHEVPLNDEGTRVLERDGLTVTMFPVDHAPIAPAVGYRFDYRGRSIVVSGDTVNTGSTRAASQGADVLFHEALSMSIVERMEAVAGAAGDAQLEKIMLDIRDYHTSPVEAARLANEAGVKQLVLYHLAPAPPNRVAAQAFMRGVSDVRPEGVTLGDDGLVVTLPLGGDAVILSEIGDYL